MQKPSVLWPPPSDEMSKKIHNSLRSRIRKIFHAEPQKGDLTATMASDRSGVVDVGTTTSPPGSGSPSNEVLSLVARTGETLTIDQQVHLYAQNSLMAHPLVSPVVSYLGGLPPLLIIASDKEVLRDEIIYV
jgi:acetyl esterase/lipase